MGRDREAAASKRPSVLRESVSSPVVATCCDGRDGHGCDKENARSKASRGIPIGLATTGLERVELGATLGRIAVVPLKVEVAPWDRERGVAERFFSEATQSLLTLFTLRS